jgi:hypothetical protein
MNDSRPTTVQLAFTDPAKSGLIHGDWLTVGTKMTDEDRDLIESRHNEAQRLEHEAREACCDEARRRY